ncbi:MAG: zf-HC2 domain-containing protein, partial [Planctomycetota bacterium]
MKCEEIKELLSEYVDGELPAADAASVGQHLAGCDACRAEFEALRQTAALVRSLPRADAPEGLTRAVTESVGKQMVGRRRAAVLRWTGVGGWLAAAAALIIVIRLVPWEGPLDPGARTEPKIAAPAADDEEAGTADALPIPDEKDRRPELALKKEAAEAAPGESPAEPKGRLADENGVPRRNGAGDLATAPRAEAELKDAALAKAAATREAGRRTDAAKTAAGAVRDVVREAEEAADPKLAAAKKDSRANKAARPAAPAAFAYECADVKTGRAAVLEALKTVRGKTLPGDDKLSAANVVMAVVPRNEVVGLIAKLKLSAWPPKAPGKGAGAAPEAEQRAPAVPHGS